MLHALVEDLYLVPSEDMVDEEHKVDSLFYCVYNKKLDAVGFVSPLERERLVQSGVPSLDALPE